MGEYVKNRGLKRQYYKDLVISFLEKKPQGCKRNEIDALLMDLIPKSSKSPATYIGRLLNEMKEKDKTIYYIHSLWLLNEQKMNEK